MFRNLIKFSTFLIFLSFQSSEKKFDNVLLSLKGKVVYVDIWASWCAPCVENIKDTKKLIEIFKDKDVAIVFLSMDGDKVKWENACKKMGINDYEYNIKGFYISEKLKIIKLRDIPRYLIFDKKGDLVNDFAPKPSRVGKLKKEIDKYLNE